MSNSVVNVISKQAKFQEMGQIPSNKGGLQEFPIIQGYTGVSFYRFFSGWKFMSNSVVNVFSKQARFQDLGPITSNRVDL